MKTINTVALIGLGAIGCAFMAEVSKTVPDADLRVVAGGERARRLRESGVRVNGKTYKFRVAEAGETYGADLLILAVKAGALERAMEDARGCVGPDTVILSFLNGITSEETLAARFGRGKVLYSYCVGTDATRVGDAVTYATMFSVPFGEAANVPGAYSENVLAVRDFFERVGVRFEIPEDMKKSLWWKYMLNMGVNQTLAVLRQPYSALQRGGFAREIARDTMLEAVEVANREGVALTSADAERAFEVVRGIDPNGKPSTLQDVEAGRRTEIEMFSGDLLRMAARHGLTLPVNDMLYRLIKAGEEAL
ncbi:MAG: ketopantoate reductase family protein [Oscillospiraceae bacterium]|jgi:2-dehydropantoate 2-reductase|nr:ketopantoate reductase family protein [Oscillospiraceae bacterium]